ncbi:MAG: hypothetical protein ACRECH_02785 [Nitrososphaerales archaeon]
MMSLTRFAQAQNSAPYARVGAFAFYDVQGGAVAFFDGIQGNISYTVTNVFANGTMLVRQEVNISEGDEVQPSAQVFNYTESIQDPKVFPVVPMTALGSSTIVFENTSLTFVKTTKTPPVGAGTFQTLEYQGTANGTSVNFYFDSATGLAIYELSGTGSVISLVTSNIATPLSVQDPTNQDLPYILLFVVIFAASGVGYYEITRYYSKQARKDFKKKWKKERMKQRRSGENPQNQ